MSGGCPPRRRRASAAGGCGGRSSWSRDLYARGAPAPACCRMSMTAGRPRCSALQVALHDGEYLGDAERLRDVAVDADVGGALHVGGHGLCGEADDGDVARRRVGLELDHGLVAAYDRHHHVHEHEVGMMLLDEIDRFAPVRRLVDRVTL